jgi:hypothetical protein
MNTLNTPDTLNISRDEEESNLENKNISQNASSHIEALQLQNDNKTVDSDETLAQLVAMGFELSTVQIAIDENRDRGFDAILQWLLQNQSINSQNEDKEVCEEIKGTNFLVCTSSFTLAINTSNSNS